MIAAIFLSGQVRVEKACEVFGLARSNYYRWRKFPQGASDETVRPTPSWSLSPEEQQKVLERLHTDRFID